jgi:hypothetical protein
VFGEEWNPQIRMNLPVTNVPRCVIRNAKTLGLQHLQLLDVVAGKEPPDRTYVIHHRTDELLVEQHTVPDGQAASPVKEGAQHAQSLSHLLSHLLTSSQQSQHLNTRALTEVPKCAVEERERRESGGSSDRHYF